MIAYNDICFPFFEVSFPFKDSLYTTENKKEAHPNIENFEKLGWDEYVPLIKTLHRFLKLKKTKLDKDEQEKL